MKKVRLDQLLVDKGLAASRERAKITIMEGSVFVEGQRVDKPGTAVDPEKQIEVRGETLAFVSRGGSSLISCWMLLAFLKSADTRQNASFSVRLSARRRDGGPESVTCSGEEAEAG